MSATSWFIIAIVGFSLAGIALIAAVFIFLKLNIPAVIGDLTGKTVARKVRAMRENNTAGYEKIHHSDHADIDRSKFAENIYGSSSNQSVMSLAHSSKRLDKTNSNTSEDLLKVKYKESLNQERNRSTTKPLDYNVAVSELPKKQVKHTAVLCPSEQSMQLPETKLNEVKSQIKHTEVLSTTNQTSVLNNNTIKPAVGTTVLSENENMIDNEPTPVAFKVVRSLIEIHTNEIVE